MKTFILSLSLSILFAIPSSFALNVETSLEQKADKVEIKHKELPEESRMDIIDKYHGAEIIKAYKETIDGEIVGYQVKIKKGPKTWVVIYDKDGNPKNKVKPE
ncbi:hypothetical protein [Owenweeksia hongkongensis]|uniref:hypothetical protein n=1 Tax=Owenweeksia hongkongensis TaxID=253245 RepID=UPI003A8D736C